MKTIAAALCVIGYAQAQVMDIPLTRKDGYEKWFEKVGVENFSFEDVPLDNDRDVGYYGPITLGSDGQTFTMPYDTGSANLIVEAKTCYDCDGPDQYDTSSSITS